MFSTSSILAWGLLALGFATVASVCVVPVFWRQRRVLLEAAYALLIVSLLFSFANGFDFFASAIGVTYGLAFLSICFLAARIHIGRLPEHFLRRNTFSTALTVMLIFVCVMFFVASAPTLTLYLFVTVMLLVALAVALGLGLQTTWALTHYIFDVKQEGISPERLPTVTLAIPARNETLALAACLDAALQSDYQKLEIIVLDDCSHDNTSALIRSYAHAGVRFIRGETPSSGWLGKTNAYNQLAKEASGELVLFLSVDTHLQRQTISWLITYISAHKLDMVSVLPKLEPTISAAMLLQEMRYVWQIILPLRQRRVPVSSEAWMIRRSVLAALGGFAGVKHKIVPEGSFARRLMGAHRYHFVIANHILPMSFKKSWRSQQETAIRLLYPTLKRQPLMAVLAVLTLFFIGLGPFLVLASATSSILWWMAFAAAILYLVLYMSVLARMQARWWWLSGLLLPAVLLQQIILIFVSMAKYEFSTVDWKGRNVCYPVLLHKRK